MPLTVKCKTAFNSIFLIKIFLERHTNKIFWVGTVFVGRLVKGKQTIFYFWPDSGVVMFYFGVTIHLYIMIILKRFCFNP